MITMWIMVLSKGIKVFLRYCRNMAYRLGEVHRLVEKSKDVFDVRKIRSDQAYAVFTTRDSIPETCYFVYEIDPKSYVVFFDLRGDYRVTMGENPVEWRRNELHGVVESSLWLAMSKYNADPQLAVVLSNIFGWTIDFFGLQKQDEFRVIYEQEYVDGKSLLNFNVLGADFRHGDSTYYAIPFELNGEKLYYDRAGKSLEGPFFESSFGFFQDFFPFLEQPFPPCVEALPGSSRCRLCCADGYSGVCHRERPGYCKKGYQAKGGGNYVKIRHNSIYTTTYMHLSRFEKGIKVGVDVAQKQVIGYVGGYRSGHRPAFGFQGI